MSESCECSRAEFVTFYRIIAPAVTQSIPAIPKVITLAPIVVLDTQLLIAMVVSELIDGEAAFTHDVAAPGVLAGGFEAGEVVKVVTLAPSGVTHGVAALAAKLKAGEAELAAPKAALVTAASTTELNADEARPTVSGETGVIGDVVMLATGFKTNETELVVSAANNNTANSEAEMITGLAATML